MGVVGAALRGFGKALSKKSGTIKSVKPARFNKKKKDLKILLKVWISTVNLLKLQK